MTGPTTMDKVRFFATLALSAAATGGVFSASMSVLYGGEPSVTLATVVTGTFLPALCWVCKPGFDTCHEPVEAVA